MDNIYRTRGNDLCGMRTHGTVPLDIAGTKHFRANFTILVRNFVCSSVKIDHDPVCQMYVRRRYYFGKAGAELHANDFIVERDGGGRKRKSCLSATNEGSDK